MQSLRSLEGCGVVEANPCRARSHRRKTPQLYLKETQYLVCREGSRRCVLKLRPSRRNACCSITSCFVPLLLFALLERELASDAGFSPTKEG